MPAAAPALSRTLTRRLSMPTAGEEWRAPPIAELIGRIEAALAAPPPVRVPEARKTPQMSFDFAG